MSKKKNLVIVESPAKARTIGKYLGPDYQVKACMGHLRDLPKSTLGVDIADDFHPDYKPIRGKESLIRELKQSAEDAAAVYLATDPDREGEAISWHLKALLGLPDERALRVTFNEITRRVVAESIEKPRAIDQNLVDAQQARRILDRIVGYQISPIMWRKIRRGLSAGRVQSVAARMVDDRDQEIAAFQPKEYWTLDAQLENGAGEAFVAHYYGRDGKKYEPADEKDVQAVIDALQRETFRVTSLRRSDKERSPAPPFTTSTMQQEASRKLNMTPRRTMAIAQQLYEGVEIGGMGAVGLITYMRTDSLRISQEAQRAAADYIRGHYGSDYCPARPRQYKARSGAQDAHEAIRPSDVTLTPERLKADLSAEQYRLYRLIWSRFLASQMANAVYDSIAVEIAAGVHLFRNSDSRLKFAGHTAVYEEGRDEEKEEKESALPELREGETVRLLGFSPTQHFTQPPAHYTEATLIRAMEEQGIGRPSTYAPTVSTILERSYVKKDGKYLLATNLGHAVTGWMETYFNDIADAHFTAHMEQRLDSVEEGKTAWKDVLREFYDGFEKRLDTAADSEYVKVPDTVSDEVCPRCGRRLVEREGRFGPFLACPGYPECQFTMPLVAEMPGRCPECGGRLMKRTGRSKDTGKQYAYYCCEFHRGSAGEQACNFRTWDVPVKDDCPVCGHTMFKKAGRGFNRPFCINPDCANFLPEEKRGYRTAVKKAGEEPAAKKPAAKKTGAKKAAKSTGAAAAKKTAAKKTAAQKAGTKKTAKQTGAKRTAVKKAAGEGKA